MPVMAPHPGWLHHPICNYQPGITALKYTSEDSSSISVLDAGVGCAGKDLRDGQATQYVPNSANTAMIAVKVEYNLSGHDSQDRMFHAFAALANIGYAFFFMMVRVTRKHPSPRPPESTPQASCRDHSAWPPPSADCAAAAAAAAVVAAAKISSQRN